MSTPWFSFEVAEKSQSSGFLFVFLHWFSPCSARINLKKFLSVYLNLGFGHKFKYILPFAGKIFVKRCSTITLQMGWFLNSRILQLKNEKNDYDFFWDHFYSHLFKASITSLGIGFFLFISTVAMYFARRATTAASWSSLSFWSTEKQVISLIDKNYQKTEADCLLNKDKKNKRSSSKD